MSSRPTVPPDWATNALYPTGSDPWSGTPTKSQPSAGKVQTGYVPNADDAAEEDNFILNNHGLWIRNLDDAVSGGDILLIDEFTGASSALANRWTLSGNGTESIVDDSANGGFGTAKINLSSSNGFIETTPIGGVGINDFRFSLRVRIIGSTTVNAILGIITLFGAEFNFSTDGSNPGKWSVNIGAVPTNVPISGLYQLLEVRRQRGVATFLIDGVVVHQTASVESINGLTLKMNGASIGHAGDAIFIDSFKFWACRYPTPPAIGIAGPGTHVESKAATFNGSQSLDGNLPFVDVTWTTPYSSGTAYRLSHSVNITDAGGPIVVNFVKSGTGVRVLASDQFTGTVDLTAYEA